MKEIVEGIICAIHRERYEVYTAKKSVFARLKSGIYYAEGAKEEYPALGDKVELEYNPLGDSMIVKTRERKTVFVRQDPDDGKGEQIVAANFDYIFIMMSLNFDFNLKRLERYITVSWQSGAQPVIILTKADIGDEAEEKLKQAQKIALGIDVYCISAVSGQGIEDIRQYLQPEKTIVFLGSSGVGKSTLTNCLLGENAMQTGEIREDDSKGHHTTTHRQMFILPNGARIMDTPGMRELGMWVVNDGIEHGFSDIMELTEKCRFHNCSHAKEPGCAVKEAIENGTLSLSRWKNYLKIQKESAFVEQKELRNKIAEKRQNNKKLITKYKKRNYNQEEY